MRGANPSNFEIAVYAPKEVVYVVSFQNIIEQTQEESKL
jgi:hypothetical protein